MKKERSEFALQILFSCSMANFIFVCQWNRNNDELNFPLLALRDCPYETSSVTTVV